MQLGSMPSMLSFVGNEIRPSLEHDEGSVKPLWIYLGIGASHVAPPRLFVVRLVKGVAKCDVDDVALPNEVLDGFL